MWGYYSTVVAGVLHFVGVMCWPTWQCVDGGWGGTSTCGLFCTGD